MTTSPQGTTSSQGTPSSEGQGASAAAGARGRVEPVASAAPVERFLGGSLVSVLFKLALLSLIVGAVMAFLGLSPHGLFRALTHFVRSILDMGSDAVREVLTWIVTGALVVVPIWLLVRLFSRR